MIPQLKDTVQFIGDITTIILGQSGQDGGNFMDIRDGGDITMDIIIIHEFFRLCIN